MEKLVRTIPVRDANGTPLILFEFHQRVERRGMLGLRVKSKRRRLQLDTGEAVDYVDENTFELATGERLHRVPPDQL